MSVGKGEVFQPGQRSTQATDRAATRGHVGVTALAVGDQLHRRVALFRNAHQRDGALEPGHEILDDRAPLVEHEPGPNPAAPQLGGDLRRALLATGFLVVSQGHEDRAAGHEPVRDEPVGGFQQAHHAQLVVDGAPAPDEPVGDGAREGRVRPRRLDPRLDRHHIGVSGEQHPRCVGIGAGPGVQQAVLQQLQPHRRVGLGVELGQRAAQSLETCSVGARRGFSGRVEHGERGVLHHGTQVGGHPLAVELGQPIRRGGSPRRRGQQPGPNPEHRQQDARDPRRSQQRLLDPTVQPGPPASVNVTDSMTSPVSPTTSSTGRLPGANVHSVTCCCALKVCTRSAYSGGGSAA